MNPLNGTKRKIKNNLQPRGCHDIKESLAREKRLSFDCKAPKEKPVERDTVSSELPPDAQRVRMATIGNILTDGNTVQDVGQAASLKRPPKSN